MITDNLLKWRISVYQFLKNPNEENSQKVFKNFDNLEKEVTVLEKNLNEKNILISKKIFNLSKNYTSFFDKFYKSLINDFNNGKIGESDEIKKVVKNMVTVELEFKENIMNIQANLEKEEKIAHNIFNEIAVNTDKIAKIIVENVNQKQFNEK